MSLKARIEAVIYAAEEPVTLAQLAALFGEEALEQKRRREAAAASEAEELAAESVDIAKAEAEVALPPESPNPEGNAEAASEEMPAEPQAQSPAEHAEPEVLEASAPSDEEAAALAVPEAIDEKKQARLREREIRDELRRTVEELMAEYAKGDRGMEIREVAGGYRIGTRPEYHDSVRAFVKSLKPPIRLSLQALETLAVIAYKQPITAPEVSEIRGVDSAGVIGSLISRKLVATAGRKQVIGRPILYKTTREFLLRFGLKDLNELPSMEEFEKMAGEFAEPEESVPLPFHESPSGPSAGNTAETEASTQQSVEVSTSEEGATIAITDESLAEDSDVPGVSAAEDLQATDEDNAEGSAAPEPAPSQTPEEGSDA